MKLLSCFTAATAYLYTCQLYFIGAERRLQQLRDDNSRRSKEVVELWNRYISSNVNSLGADSRCIYLFCARMFAALLILRIKVPHSDMYDLSYYSTLSFSFILIFYCI